MTAREAVAAFARGATVDIDAASAQAILRAYGGGALPRTGMEVRFAVWRGETALFGITTRRLLPLGRGMYRAEVSR